MESNATELNWDIFYNIFDMAEALDYMLDWNTINEIKSHGFRVANTSIKIAKKLGMYESEIEDLKICGIFHDIGKLFIKQKILNKKGPLTKDELKIIKMHTVHSKDYLYEKGYKSCSDIVLYHHERVDGSGYYGLKGNEIPLESCILAIADVWDALRCNRAYRKAYKKAAALQILAQEKHKYEKEVYSAFCELYAR